MKTWLWMAMGLVPAALYGQEASRNPHGPLRFECAQCHVAEGWTPIRTSGGFDHEKLGFALTGAHAKTSCRSCHQSLTFAATATACVDCHRDPHQSELGPDCTRCHTTRSFIDRTQMTRMHQTTRFPLRGAHMTLDCESCHVPAAQGGLLFTSHTTDCIECHLRSFQTVRQPDHQGSAFSRDCTQCHTMVAWAGARFDHNGTRFPLTGAHRALTCQQCHGDQGAGTAAANCVSCHQADYDRTTNPGHVSASFPTDCAACHTTTTWAGAQFDHNLSRFPLTGAHRTAACTDCHGDGVYSGKPVNCVGCHQTDYDRSTNPGHVAASFPTDCVACHSTTTWAGATFDHDGPFFPIYSGRHRGRWSSCADCHTNPAAYSQFTCAQCHRQSEMDSHHRGIRNYAPDPPSCVRCHPDGRSP